jgi:hypothetical protein
LAILRDWNYNNQDSTLDGKQDDSQMASAECQRGTRAVKHLTATGGRHRSPRRPRPMTRRDRLRFINNLCHRLRWDPLQRHHIFTGCAAPQKVREGRRWTVDLHDLPHTDTRCLALALGASECLVLDADPDVDLPVCNQAKCAFKLPEVY